MVSMGGSQRPIRLPDVHSANHIGRSKDVSSVKGRHEAKSGGSGVKIIFFVLVVLGKC